MEPHRDERSGLYRPRVATRIPRSVPDGEFNEIFARLGSHRDRALVAFYVSTGARASELLSATMGGVDPGRQLISVVRKGSRQTQQLPASTDAFVWLRLYQLEMEGLIPAGRRQPLWWTLRRPARPLTYHAVHRMFERVNERAGTAATLHSLRHTAAYRMAEDPALPLTDVQFVLGHALLTTTQIYLTPRKEDVIRRLLAHHAEATRRAAERVAPPPAPGYRPETLEVLFGDRRLVSVAVERSPSPCVGDASDAPCERSPRVPAAAGAAVVAGHRAGPRRGARPSDVAAVRRRESRRAGQACRRRGTVARLARGADRGAPGSNGGCRARPISAGSPGDRAAGHGWPNVAATRDGTTTTWPIALRVAISADVVRPSLAWLLSGATGRGALVRVLACSRDPEGFARLRGALRRRSRRLADGPDPHAVSRPR